MRKQKSKFWKRGLPGWYKRWLPVLPPTRVQDDNLLEDDRNNSAEPMEVTE